MLHHMEKGVRETLPKSSQHYPSTNRPCLHLSSLACKRDKSRLLTLLEPTAARTLWQIRDALGYDLQPLSLRPTEEMVMLDPGAAVAATHIEWHQAREPGLVTVRCIYDAEQCVRHLSAKTDVATRVAGMCAKVE
eukprot:TRINITY_DN28_c1_g1_i1.p3 TRINITY_DN28_c1_g1~~TRINITY_DN28_c1_g1_i1.p3  ORF type:complete len:135 (+),score=27.05 TRINITY_DN28_c1_g1_i1:418-822(+)